MNWNYVLQHPNWPDSLLALGGLAFLAFVIWLYFKYVLGD